LSIASTPEGAHEPLPFRGGGTLPAEAADAFRMQGGIAVQRPGDDPLAVPVGEHAEESARDLRLRRLDLVTNVRALRISRRVGAVDDGHAALVKSHLCVGAKRRLWPEC
jgi:hypothetical protein